VELEGDGERVARRARPAPFVLSLFLLLVPCCRSAKAFISFFRAVVFLVLNWMTVLSWWWWWGDGGNGRREEGVKEEGQQRAREWFSAATHAVPPRVKKKQRRAPFVPPRMELLPLPHPWGLGQPQGGAMSGAHEAREGPCVGGTPLPCSPSPLSPFPPDSSPHTWFWTFRVMKLGSSPGRPPWADAPGPPSGLTAGG